VIVLVGFMGAGKTIVGRSLARLLSQSFVDTDSEIERRAGVPVAEIFSTWGEDAFRELERQVVAETLVSQTGVVALGGGALGDPATRSLLSSTPTAQVIHLDVDLDEALERVGGDVNRPLLRNADVSLLYEDRRRLYEGVTSTSVTTSRRTPDEVAGEIVGLITGEIPPQRIRVAAAGGSYDVVVGRALLSSASQFVPSLDTVEQVFVITDGNLRGEAEAVAASFRDGMTCRILEVPAGEAAKTLEWAGQLYDALAENAAHRHDIVVAVGGGAVTDVAGFVASTFNRGMSVAYVPTSLTAQADASIGGKTGINLPHAKNLVGTFHQPSVVVCDVAVLGSLPVEEVRAGLAEVIKHGFIAEPDLIHLVEKETTAILDRDAALLTELVARSARIKAAIVSSDEREHGVRALLNYGHTFAHAIEQIGSFAMRHGEAVAIGMMAAAHLGHALGRLDDDAVELHRSVLSAVGLPVTASLDFDALERAWFRDKKYRGGVRFVLLAEIGRAEAGINAPREAIVEALERLKT
jgi:shikimate kinase/3-dehydroquinate synthase